MTLLSSLLFAATAAVQGTNPAAVSFNVPAGAIGVRIDAAAEVGPIKPMNAVNNGPTTGASGSFRWFKGARIPFARTNDANFAESYGGPHTVDVHVVFPNFDADETDPANYDFDCTDRYLGEIRAAGSEIFYRLGASIEHQARKYGTRPPKDFAKWARICEHVIRHYNEGWADGFRWNVRYWEIWNEADLDADDAADKRCWGGTEAEYFDFHEMAAKRLKAAFPHLKIGGPALAYREDWGRRFIREMARRQVPMDFFSWHCYTSKIGPASDIRTRARWVRAALDEAGYTATESILDEWNATPHWTNDSREFGRFMGSPRGAALVAAIMSAMQDDRVDMLMYYDARPATVYNGLFSLYGGMPRAPYFALFAWGRLAALGTQVRTAVTGSSDTYATAAKGADGSLALLVARYDENGNWHRTEKEVRVSVKGRPLRTARVHVVDDDLLYTEVPCEIVADGSLVLRLAPAAFAFVEDYGVQRGGL